MQLRVEAHFAETDLFRPVRSKKWGVFRDAVNVPSGNTICARRSATLSNVMDWILSQPETPNVSAAISCKAGIVALSGTIDHGSGEFDDAISIKIKLGRMIGFVEPHQRLSG